MCKQMCARRTPQSVSPFPKISTIPTTTTTRGARTLQEGIFKCMRSNHYLSLPARGEIVRCGSRSHHSPVLSCSLSPPICRRWFTSRRSPLRLRPKAQRLGMCVIARADGAWGAWILDSWMWCRTDGCLRRQIDVSHVWATPLLCIKQLLP